MEQLGDEDGEINLGLGSISSIDVDDRDVRGEGRAPQAVALPTCAIAPSGFNSTSIPLPYMIVIEIWSMVNAEKGFKGDNDNR